MAFWVLHDHLGKLIVANLLWVAAVALPLSTAGAIVRAASPGHMLLGSVALLFALAGFVPIVTAGMAHMVKTFIDRGDGSLGDLFEGVRLYWRRATTIGMTYLLLVACLSTSAWFYATRLQTSFPLVGYVLSAIAVWGLVFAAVVGLFVMPALVQRRASAISSVRLAGLLVLANPGFCTGVALQVCFLSALALAFPPLVVIIYASAVVTLASCGYEILARKYAESAVPTHSAGRSDADDDYLNRGIRDLFFPWKS
jgi:uncharacterized membrane protein YesL